ncbi:hypothetical protein D3C84_1057440 [compost metagenome]
MKHLLLTIIAKNNNWMRERFASRIVRADVTALYRHVNVFPFIYGSDYKIKDVDLV